MQKQKHVKISYGKLFWLYLFGSVAGVLLEGLFCLVKKGRWESHVVSVFAPYNSLYGLGAILFYVGAVKLKDCRLIWRVLLMAALATVLELVCGLLLRYGLGMRAWNYQNLFLNYKGLICPLFSLGWAAAACVFCLLVEPIDRLLEKCTGKIAKTLCACLSVFIAVDLTLTGTAIVRWSDRHYGAPAENRLQTRIDEAFPDDWMQSRFIEWRFIDIV